MRFHEFLIEYNQQLTVQNFGDKVIDRFRTEGERAWNMMLMDRSMSSVPEYREQYKNHLIKEFEKMDPTPHKEYVQWLCRTYVNALGVVTKLEDYMSRGKDSLERFQKLKIKQQLKPEHRYINRFKSFQDFEQVVSSYPEIEPKQVDRGQSQLVHQDDELRIIWVKDETAAKFWGQGTQWCTAAKNNNMFEQYNKKGPLFVIIPSHPQHIGDKYQFHFETGQFMDPTDTPLDLWSWVKTYPQLKDIFENTARKNVVIPLLKNGDYIQKHWEAIMGSAAVDIAESGFPLGKIVTYVQRDLSNSVVSNGAYAAQIAAQLKRDIINDKDGLLDLFAYNIKPEMFNNDDLFMEVMNDPLADWLFSSETGELIQRLSDTKAADGGQAVDEYGATMSVTDAIFTYIIPLFKREVAKYLDENS